MKDDIYEFTGSTKWCHSNDDEPDYAVQRISMLFERRRPKKIIDRSDEIKLIWFFLPKKGLSKNGLPTESPFP